MIHQHPPKRDAETRIIRNSTPFYCWACERRCQPSTVGLRLDGYFQIFCPDCRALFTALPGSAKVPNLPPAPAPAQSLFARLATALVAAWWWRWAR